MSRTKKGIFSIILILFQLGLGSIVPNGKIDEFIGCPNGCICSYNNLNCSNPETLGPVSRTLNSSIESFQVIHCNSNAKLIIEWLTPASSSLQKLKINYCAIENLIAENATTAPTFQHLEEIDFAHNQLSNLRVDALEILFANAKSLNLRVNALRDAYNFSSLIRLRNFDLSYNEFATTPSLPWQLQKLNISHNPIRAIHDSDFSNLSELQTLDLSNCAIDHVQENAFAHAKELRELFLNDNRLTQLPSTTFRQLSNLHTLDLSSNCLDIFDAAILLPNLAALKSLAINKNPIQRMSRFPAELVRLEDLSIANTDLIYFDFFLVSNLKNLKALKLKDNRRLRSCVGSISSHAPSLNRLDISNCALTHLPTTIFENGTSKLNEIDLSGNPWACDCRLHQWIHRLTAAIKVKPPIFCPMNNSNQPESMTLENCSIGVAVASGSIERTTHSSDLILDCGVYGDPSPTVSWEKIIGKKSIGVWNPKLENTSDCHGNEKYGVLPGGLLLIRRAIGDDIGPYRCTVQNQHGNASALIFLRLDYSSWWEMKLFSVVCGILTAIAFFILNVIYAAIRRLVIWRISKLEQTSRVRLLLEAMEKYRQRQMESLHEKYATKMNQIRDNYHCQVEQMRRSYCAQAERFRDYRAAQMEYMSHHIDSIRDNYNWQANRVREYGSRQMERLWESYQRQANRLRAFSLQQRLRLMRQYKIKQRYWNKIFESINAESGHHSKTSSERVGIPPEMIELPDIPAAVVDDDLLKPGPSSAQGLPNLIDEFDDALSTLITHQGLDEMEDCDGSSYHSATSETIDDDLESEILSQLEDDTNAAMKKELAPKAGNEETIVV